MFKPDNLYYLIGLKFFFCLFSGMLLRLLMLVISRPGVRGNSERRWRFWFFFKSVNFLIILGYIWLVLNWPLWIWLQLKVTLIPALLIDDLLNLVFLSGYLTYFLWESFRYYRQTNMLSDSFGLYIKQYGYFWLLVLSILIFARIDNFYLPVVANHLSWELQLLLETGLTAAFIILQMLLLYLRKLQMVEAGPELRLIVNEVAQRFKLKIKNIRIWRLERVSNAFATGFFWRSIFLTDYLVDAVNGEDLRMIIGHECAHFKQRHLEIRVLTVGVLIYLGSTLMDVYPGLPWFVFVAFGLISFLVFRTLSRYQELQADRLAAARVGDPEKMTAALMKIYSLNSTPGKFGNVIKLLVGHPDLETRIRKLQKLSRASS